MENITLLKTTTFDDLVKKIRKVEFRGLYNEKGDILHPYKNVSFSIAKVFPPLSIQSNPLIKTTNKKEGLFSPQPTIYNNQIEIIKTVDNFLKKHKKRVHKIEGVIEYSWEGRGIFHMIPPIIERHLYKLKNGFIDLDSIQKYFKGTYVKDHQGNLHTLNRRYLENFYIDEISNIPRLDIFHSNATLINYGLKYNRKENFNIICDGSHRIDYALEYLQEPITVILVESKKSNLIPYYAFPMPFRPTIRLSSKKSEKMYPKLERDKIHLLNDFLKKTLHYDWTPAGLNMSKLRANWEIF